VRYPPAIWRGTDKHGYGNDDTCLGEGIVAHSMEGPLAAAFGELDRPDRQASWHFSIAKDGTVYQHIETENISYASGSYQANRRFWSMEHEGVAGEPLEPPQKASSIGVMGWLLSTHGLVPVRLLTLFEHRDMTAYGAAATACPSNRIPWNEIIAALQEDDMPFNEDDKAWINAANRLQLEAVMAWLAIKFNELKYEIQQDDTLAAAARTDAEAILNGLAERLKQLNWVGVRFLMQPSPPGEST